MASQTRHPWRATARTVIAATLGLASLLPVIAAVGHLDTLPGAGWVLAVAAGVTRVLAIPAVEQWLRQYLPWLAAEPAKTQATQPEETPDAPTPT